MLLRSSSTPILGSLLPSHLDSPKHTAHHPELLNSPRHRPNKRLSVNQTGPLNGIPPTSPSTKSTPKRNKSDQSELRRVQSEGNLIEMISAAWSCFDHELKLRQDQEAEKERGLKVESRSRQQRSMQEIGKSSASVNINGLNMLLEKDVENVPSKMHLAMGFGAMTGGLLGVGVRGGLSECQGLGLGGGGSDQASVEEHYKRMVEENPGDSLYLRNYAQFLYQTKRDLNGAEEFYSRAILADPSDGDLLSQYATLTWELHHDEERASSYFERAVQVAPEDSHVLAAYAGFLWEAEDQEEACPEPAFNNRVAVKAY